MYRSMYTTHWLIPSKRSRIRRLITLLSLMLPIFTAPLSANQCQIIEDKFYENSSVSNWDLFASDVATTMPPWKAKLMLQLLKSYENHPDFHIRHYRRHGVRIAPKSSAKWPKHDVFLPYALSAPKIITDAFIDAARIHGLSRGEKYLIVPGKLIAANATKGFFSHLFAVLAFGPLSTLISSVGLSIESSIIKYGNEDNLKRNEIILYIVTDRNLVTKSGNKASLTATKNIDDRVSSKQWKLDLSAKYPGWKTLVAMVKNFVNLKLAGTPVKIKRVITSTHGASGRIFFDNDSITLNAYAELLRPLSPYLADHPEFYFEGCDIAGDEQGRTAITAFSHMMQKKGVWVEANRIQGMAGFSAGSPTDFNHGVDRSIDTMFYIHPSIYMGGLLYVLMRTSIGSATKHGSGPLFLEETKFTYEIPAY